MSKTALLHPAKAIYFATGAPELALRDITRLGLASNGTALRVVSPQAGCQAMARHPMLRNTPVIPYTPGRALWVWLRLLGFLGLTRNAEMICLHTPQNYRLLKLLAFSLRGRGRFSTGEGSTQEISVLGMVRLSWHNYWIRHEQRVRAMPMLVIGSGSARSLRLIAARLRSRFPGQRIVAWLPASLADELAGTFDETVAIGSGFGNYLATAGRLLRRCRQFKASIIPCTNEFNRWMKIPALLCPLRQKEIYNEVGDAFKVADSRGVMRHARWRFFRTNRKLAWPIAVVGSASGFYLEKIVASLRQSFPGSELHGWLSPPQAGSAAHLFDVVYPLPEGGLSVSAARLIARGRRYRSWVIPCTDEPFRLLKLLAFCIPLPNRRLYNETGDGFPLRQLSTVWRHIFWRLRYKFTFQILSGSAGSSLLRRLVHIPSYAVRLASAVPQLLMATRAGKRKPAQSSAALARSVEVLATQGAESSAALAMAFTDPAGRLAVKVQELHSDRNIFDQLSSAALSSSAEYICILDGQCNLTTSGWLERLIGAFDETVAQVGPELYRPDSRSACQGAFFDGSGGLVWNTNSAARFHGRPELLEVAALPWVCLVIRREALLQAIPQCAQQRSSLEWIMAGLCHELAVNGWLSICNTEVAVSHPLKAPTGQLQLSTAS